MNKHLQTKKNYLLLIAILFGAFGRINLYSQGLEGASHGCFSVSNSKKVFFSNGNLQYQPSTNTWRFAINPWEYSGASPSLYSETSSSWIDLFGWGTSGYNHGAVCYQPWSISETNSDYYPYGNYQYNLYDQTGKADWGYNPISNGGNRTNQWRTLTKSEWEYLLCTRSTFSGIRYCKARVNGVNGVILLPDDWPSSLYQLRGYNSSTTDYNYNTMSSGTWSQYFEEFGAVFLPATGYRQNAYINYGEGSHWCYWTASSGNYYPYEEGGMAYEMKESGGAGTWRYYGHSVRLVTDCFDVNATSSPAVGGAVSGSGPYSKGVTCTLTATPYRGYTFVNWTTNGGAVVSTSASYTFTVTGERNLVANFNYNGGGNAPTGAIDSKFTINADGDQVCFSSGNLQYQPNTNVWRFAINQWDCVGSNSPSSETSSGWMDLFSWGTSGYNHGAVCYQPWS